ncbi:MAG TPA: L-aspartate oxidase [Nitrospiria bacterium]|nr:L-aspartate oxidase [Nitrospiria bacterium]
MPPRTDRSFAIQTVDFLIIGSGIAGLRAAIDLSRFGKVLILNKGAGRESNSAHAQGGIAAAVNPYDSSRYHYQDTIRAGKGLCKPSAVKILVEEGILRVRELIAWGTPFDRKGKALALTHEAAHSRSRVLRAGGDATGDEIIRSLYRKTQADPNIRLLDHHFTLDLYLEGGRCKGSWVLEEEKNIVKLILARGVLMATGGAGQIYLRTTNPSIATGDGTAMGYRAGAVLEDMEFVQFHPTALCLPRVEPFLLSETMRGEGGILRNVNGEAFMKRYHPDAELAPRDLVSRAIWAEMDKTGKSFVYLDMTSLEASELKNRFPNIYKTCLNYGINITRDLIPTSPSAHFMMGGIQTDLRGFTGIPGLYASGEAACTGVHGANRLASNSLLEGLVFGARAAEEMARTSISAGSGAGFNLSHLTAKFRLFLKKPPEKRQAIAQREKRIKKLMWENVGIIRTGKDLRSALSELRKIDKELNYLCLDRKTMEARNMATVSCLVTKAAALRKESLGAHFRLDFPQTARKKSHSFQSI